MYAIKQKFIKRIPACDSRDNFNHPGVIYSYSRKAGCVGLEIEAWTTGYLGGDNSETYFRIEDTDNSCQPMDIELLGKGGNDGVQIHFSGDFELDAMIKGLKFIVKVLEDGCNRVDDW